MNRSRKPQPDDGTTELVSGLATLIVEGESPVRSTGAPEDHDQQRRTGYDRAFQPAITTGHLTVEQAVQRGSRQAYAESLHRRHELGLEVALAIADNRASLSDAIDAAHAAVEVPPQTSRRGASDALKLLVFAMLLVCLALVVGLQLRSLERRATSDRPPSRPAPLTVVGSPDAIPKTRDSSTTPAAAIERDEQSRVTRISAGHPARVLEDVCQLASGPKGCVWKDLRRLEPHRPGHRIGQFIDPAGDGTIRSVYIRRDNSGRWAVGTGLRPLDVLPEPVPAPTRPMAGS